MGERSTVIDPTSGIYRIRCTLTGKVYIGSSLNIDRRLYGHRRHLASGKHVNAHLQAAWNKYGPDAFEFEIVEIVEPTILLEVEQFYIDWYQASDRERGFNIRLKAESNVGLPVSDETRRRISIAQLGHGASAETRAKIGAKHKGKTISLEARAKMRAAKLGKKMSETARQNMAAAVRARGPEYHARLSESKKGNKNSLGRKQSPEVRVKISAASKAMWAQRRADNG